MNFSKSVSEAITSLLRCDPFYGSRLIEVEVIEVVDTKEAPAEVATAATDCFRKVWVNRRFFDKIALHVGNAGCVAVLIHELQHITRLHGAARFEGVADLGVNQLLWNFACDFVINRSLLSDGYAIAALSTMDGGAPFSLAGMVNLLEGGVCAEGIKAAGICFDPNLPLSATSEEVYAELIAALKKNPMTTYTDLLESLAGPLSGDQQGDSASKERDEGEGEGEGEVATSPSAFEKAAKEAGLTPEQAVSDLLAANKAAAEAAESRERGSAPAYVQDLITRAEKSYVPWQRVLRRFVSELSRDDFSYRRLSRRNFDGLTVSPGTYSEKVGVVAVVVDSSGSVADVELAQALAELSTIVKRVKPTKVVIVQCDADVTSVQELRPSEDLRVMPFTGRGGTDMSPAFQYIQDNYKKVACLICFTDGELACPPKALVKSPVLWGICADRNTSFQHDYGSVVVIGN